MVVQSKQKTFGFYYCALSFLGGISAAIYFSISGFKDIPLTGIIFLCFVLFLLISITGRFLYDANLIRIDIHKRTITFINQLTRVKRTYTFDHFDGKMISAEFVAGKFQRTLYLIKDRRAIKKISKFMYSNLGELEEALNQITDLGSFNQGFLKSWKISLRLPIVD